MIIDPLRSPVNEISLPTPAAPSLLRPKQEQPEFVDQLRAKLDEGQAKGSKLEGKGDDSDLHKAFNDFVGQTLFGRLIASMRATQNEPAYMHGGQAEKIFQNQFDQVLAEEMTKASADTIADPMYELFRASRSS